MKRFLLFLFVLCMLLPPNVRGEEYYNDVSPAIPILRKQTKLQKQSSPETAITFCADDFKALLGKGASHVTVLSLPEGGSLQLSGVDLEKGQLLSLSSLDRLSFIPATQESFSTAFQFKDSGKTNALALDCVLHFSEDETKTSQSRWIETYRDCMTQIQLLTREEAEQGWTIRLQNSTNSGLLSAQKDGTIVYSPKTGFEGTDGFRYQYVHSDGRVSKEADVRIRVNAPYRDVFFANLRSSPLHAFAIDFCKYTQYEAVKDENGNYVFDLSSTLTAGEAEEILQKLMDSKSYDREVFEDEENDSSLRIKEILAQVTKEEDPSSFTYAQAALAVSYTLHGYRTEDAWIDP